MRAFEVEGVDIVGKDTVLDIKVLPNRAFDCLSHIGMAREIAAIMGIKYKVSSIKYKEDKSLKVKDFLSIEVKDKKLCPRYSARVVVDVKVGDSPKWMQDRLIACGLRPINNIVDITNYVMLETGQPLHAFDFDKLSFVTASEAKQSRGISMGLLRRSVPRNDVKIIVRRAKEGEKITTLDGEEYKLNENILVIADGKEPLAIAGIKGGNKAEISKNTKTVILESANFDSVSTRKSSKALNLRTDASVRFESGLDINLTVQALERTASLISDLAGGKVASGIADVFLIKPKRISTAVVHSYAESLLGIKIKASEILSIFKRLGLSVHIHKKKGEIFYEISVPNRRNDLLTSEDLIEEIGRIYGYENISAVMPTSILIPAIKNEELINEEKAKNIMVGAGYSEVYNYSLISEERKDIFAFEGVIGPRYPLSNDQKYLRPTLIVRLLENIEDNLRYFDAVRIFEIGKIFQQKNESIEERRMIAGGLCKSGVKIEELFKEMKGIVDLLLEKMGVSEFSYNEIIKEGDVIRTKEIDRAGMFYPRRAQIKVGEKEIGWIGEINKGLLRSRIIPAVFFELDFGAINELIEEEIEYQAPSKYPAIIRDLSIIVPQETRVDDALNTIENVSGPLVIDVDFIDDYETEDRDKSLTFKLVFQSYEKTLTDAEVNKIMGKIIKAVEGEGWEIRS